MDCQRKEGAWGGGGEGLGGGLWGIKQRERISSLAEKGAGSLSSRKLRALQSGHGQTCWGFTRMALPSQIHQKKPSQRCQALWTVNYCHSWWFTAQQQHNPRPGPCGGDHPHLPAGCVHLRVHRQPQERQRGLPSAVHRPLRRCRPLGGGECPGRRTGQALPPGWGSPEWSHTVGPRGTYLRSNRGLSAMRGSLPPCERNGIKGHFSHSRPQFCKAARVS